MFSSVNSFKQKIYDVFAQIEPNSYTSYAINLVPIINLPYLYLKYNQYRTDFDNTAKSITAAKLQDAYTRQSLKLKSVTEEKLKDFDLDVQSYIKKFKKIKQLNTTFGNAILIEIGLIITVLAYRAILKNKLLGDVTYYHLASAFCSAATVVLNTFY